MKLTPLFLLAFATLGVSASRKKRDTVAAESTTQTTGPLTLTATRVFNSLIDEDPFMTTVTSEVVWTQFPASTSN